MKAIYHLRKLSDDTLGMEVKLTTPTGEQTFFTRSRQKPASLTQLFKLCKNNIGTVLWKNNLGSGHTIEWDEDPSEILDMGITGVNTYKKRIPVTKTDVDDMVYEVIKVDGSWVVIKHDCPLLTWDEAVAELKKRI